jgi:hypothetical protein
MCSHAPLRANCARHKTLRVTPAMAAGITDRVWDFAEIVKLMDDVNAPGE